jgi:transcriptional regulator with XRE-family HTH domain
METKNRPVGEILRSWRRHRRVSQLDLALDAEVSTRHISFVETGRSRPSREMLLRLAEQLEIPLRERNGLMVAAGYAPVYAQTSLDEPEMRIVREAIDLVLTGHEPFPAIAIDRHWNLVTANRAAPLLLMGIDLSLLEPPINVLRVSLHPRGLATRIVNLDQWRSHVFRQLRRRITMVADPTLISLYEELHSFPTDDAGSTNTHAPSDGPTVDDLVIPLRIKTEVGLLSFFSTTTVFSAANVITLSELAIESFFPADTATADALRQAMSSAS